MSSDLDTARTVRSWLRSQPDESANRLIEAALAEAVSTPQERPRWTTARFTFANPVVIASVVATLALVVLGGYQFLIVPSVGTPQPSAVPSSPQSVPSQLEPPVETPPPVESLPSGQWPSGVPDPCLILSAEDLDAVLQLPGRLRGDRTPAPPDPDRVFCAYFQGGGDYTGGTWLTNFWIFYDLTEWPSDPRARAEAVLRGGYGGVSGGEIEEMDPIADRRVWGSRNSFLTADDRYMYMLKLHGNWVSAHPTALTDLATVVIGNLEAGATPAPVVHLLRGELVQLGDIAACDLPNRDPIRIRDEGGNTVATGETGGWNWGNGVHVTDFEVEDVPERAFYTIEIGDLVNQPLSLAELTESDWMVELEAPCTL